MFAAFVKYCSLIALLFLLGCKHVASSPGESWQRYEFIQTQMGLPFRMVLYATNAVAAKEASDAAFARIKQLNDILSDYDSDSELSRLSHTSGQGKRILVGDDLWHVLEESQKYAEASQGAFDVTIGPVVNLWRYARLSKHLPDPEKLAKARRAVGYKNLKLYPKTHEAELLVPNMRLDAGALAKVYAIDEALKVLKQHQVSRALIAGSGDMAASDAPPGKPGWKIELSSLDETNTAPNGFVWLKNGGLATSGDRFQKLEIDGKRYSHIVDPRTGIGLTDHSLVTVIAPDAVTANGLSTSVSVLGPDGLKLVEKTPGAAARLLRQPGDKVETFETRRFRAF